MDHPPNPGGPMMAPSASDRPPMTPKNIKQITDTILTKCLGEASSDQAANWRMEEMAHKYTDFAQTYPALFSMCCKSVTPESQNQFREFRDMMLRQLQSMESRGRTLKAADKVIGKKLGYTYLPKDLMDKYHGSNGDTTNHKRRRQNEDENNT